MIRALLTFALVAMAADLGLFGVANADTQQPVAPRRIGVLLGGFSPESKEVEQFRQGLLDAGYVEGRDVVIEWRFAGGDYARMPALVADLVQREEVIVVTSTVGAQAAKRATSTLPIVMAVVADPVGSGLVADLAHTGGNVTGNAIMTPDLSAKRLQLLKETVPGATRVAVLWNPDAPYSSKVIEQLKAAAPSLSIELTFLRVRAPEEIDPTLSAVSRTHAQALYVIEAPLFEAHRPAVLKLASKARLPITYWERRWPEEGGLMSYGPSLSALFRRAAGYVDKILKGAKPGDLPIEQPTQFELVVNLKTAKALGITIPESILLRADEIIR
jgi:putative ABC transport system substrate-binding protein